MIRLHSNVGIIAGNILYRESLGYGQTTNWVVRQATETRRSDIHWGSDGHVYCVHKGLVEMMASEIGLIKLVATQTGRLGLTL